MRSKRSHLYHLFFSLTRIHTSSDVLGKSLADLQKQFSEILARSQWEREEAQVRERKLQEEMALQQEKLASGQEEFRQACERALEARVRKGRERQLEGSVWPILRFSPNCSASFSCKYRILTVIFTLNKSNCLWLKFNPEYGYWCQSGVFVAVFSLCWKQVRKKCFWACR